MKKLMLFSLLLVLVLGTIACGRSEIPPSPNNPDELVHQYGLDNPGFVGSSSSGSGLAVPMPTTTPGIIIPTPTVIIPPFSGGSGSYNAVPVPDRMVIRSAYLSLVVDDVSASLTQINSLAASFGGYVVNSNMSEQQNRLYASISFRVDAARFNEALQALRDIAVDVRSESTSGQDVTEEYIDLDARLRNLEASEAQLLELMKQAGTVEEILKVQQRLVDTREEIEQTKGRMQYLEQSAALSYFEVSLEQSRLAVEFVAFSRTAGEDEGIQFESTISGGFSPYTYEWNFGDGETSTEAHPVHAYNDSGVYTVTLNVKDDKDHSADFSRADYISVSASWEAGNTAGSAWKGLVALGHFFVNLLIWLGYFSPLWIAILLILYFTWWRKRKKKVQS
jgi:hypothetical protein